MGFLFGDSFDYVSGGSAGDLHWSAYVSAVYIAGRYGTGYAAGGGSFAANKVFPSSYETLIWAMAFKTPSSFSSEVTLARKYYDTTCHVSLHTNTSGNLVLYRDWYSTILQTSSNILSPSTWYWLSWKSYINDSSGTSEIRLNGSSTGWINYSGDTRNGSTAAVSKIQLDGSSVGFYYDDLIIMDTSGSTMNDHITERKAILYVPNGAGGYTQWTPSTGSNYQCVDEKAYNSDTDYVYTSTAANRDSYTHETVSGFSTIDAVQLRGVIRKDDVDSHTASLFYRRSSTNYDGTAATVNAGYSEICRINEVDPATSAAWTVSNLNNTELGVLLDT